MGISEDRWSAYARIQSALDRRQLLDDRAWGFEAGLNRLVDMDVSAADAERAVATGDRMERERRRLLRIHGAVLRPLQETSPADSFIDGRLLAMLDQLSPRDRQLVELRADGYSFEAAARVLGVTPGALRVRMTRVRERLRGAG